MQSENFHNSDNMLQKFGVASSHVLVLGMHRCGTSLTSSIIHKLGIDMVRENDPGSTDNAKGHWERFDMLSMHDAILNIFGQTWSSLASLPAAWWREPTLGPLKKQLLDKARELEDGLPWGLKDPRVTRLLPLWNEIYTALRVTPKVVLCVRNPKDVAASLTKRNNFDQNYGKLLWLRYYTDFFQTQHPKEWLVINYDDWFDNGLNNTIKILKYLNIENSISAINVNAIHSETVTSELQHNKSEVEYDYCGYLYNKILQTGTDQETNDEVVSIFSNLELLNKYYTKIYQQSDLYTQNQERLEANQATQAESLCQTVEELQQKQHALTVEKDSLQDALDREREAAAGLNRELEQALAAKDSLMAERDTLAATLDREREAAADLNRKLERALAAKDSLMAQRETLNREREASAGLNRELERALAAKDSLMAVRETLAATLDRERKAAADLNSELEQALAAKDSLMAERACLLESLAVLASRLKMEALPAFDEVFYRKKNPDVAQALAAGDFASGFQHWLFFGLAEGREAAFSRPKPTAGGDSQAEGRG